MATRSPLMNMMVRAAEKAARNLKRDFGEIEQLQISVKGPTDFVTNADIKAEKTIREELHKARPEFGFLLEESGAFEGSDKDQRFIVDPLDGTLNFLHGIPHWSISIAAEKNNEIIAGLVFDPIKDEMFWAEKGSGAYMNAQRLRVSGRKEMGDAVIATGTPSKGRGNHEQFLGQVETVLQATAGLRRFGSAALDLCYVAAGRFDGFWEANLKPWDVAAGILIVREAGGSVSEVGGGKNPVYGNTICAANAQLHRPLLKLLEK